MEFPRIIYRLQEGVDILQAVELVCKSRDGGTAKESVNAHYTDTSDWPF